MNSPLNFFLFGGEIITIYFLSHLVLQKAYGVLARIGSKQMVVGVLSLLYEPGTILHELSHYFVALVLNMHPREINIFPLIEENKIRLGHVLYEKNKGDFIRPILVGIAPFFGAMIVLLLIVYSKLFPGNQLWQTVVFGYLILAITANMFSSPQDLVDVGYLIPLGLIIGILLYLFPITISPSYIKLISDSALFFIHTIQPPLLFSIVFHAILVVLLMKFE
ncbi:MAG: hypothetical protein V1922_04035 [bacterium]